MPVSAQKNALVCPPNANARTTSWTKSAVAVSPMALPSANGTPCTRQRRRRPAARSTARRSTMSGAVPSSLRRAGLARASFMFLRHTK